MKDVTFVLMSCGEPTELRCLEAFHSVRPHVEFFSVKNVYPQAAALNQMIQGVQTEWFVPLDADIILNEDAWSRIEAALDRHSYDSSWHTILFPLWDTRTEQKILALKLLRTEACRRNLFSDTPTPDVEHFERLSQGGQVCIDRYVQEGPIGLHVVEGKRYCYAKYRDVYQTYRTYGKAWDSGVFLGGHDLRSHAKAHFDYFVFKWFATGDREYLYCVAGMMDGIMSPLDGKSKTLERVEYRIKVKEACACFYDWYTQAYRRMSFSRMV